LVRSVIALYPPVLFPVARSGGPCFENKAFYALSKLYPVRTGDNFDMIVDLCAAESHILGKRRGGGNLRPYNPGVRPIRVCLRLPMTVETGFLALKRRILF
jgi:hypothetical protein